MSIQKKLILMISGAALFAAFQNCHPSSQPVAFTNIDSLKSENGGSGQPYDGKIYVLLGEACPDQSNVHAKIVLNTRTSGQLIRENCEDITPVNLGENDFRLDETNTNKLYYQEQVFEIVGTPLDMKLVEHEIGLCYWMNFDFGTPPDTEAGRNSRLQIYENGRPLGPAHTGHEIIRNSGGGRFSHWYGYLRFSTSDNSDPLTNGRVYTYEILPERAP